MPLATPAALLAVALAVVVLGWLLRALRGRRARPAAFGPVIGAYGLAAAGGPAAPPPPPASRPGPAALPGGPPCARRCSCCARPWPSRGSDPPTGTGCAPPSAAPLASRSPRRAGRPPPCAR